MAESKTCISCNIKMYPEEKERFEKLVSEMDNVTTQRGAFVALMDFFENPKTVKVDNPELIKKNQELQDEIDELQETVANLKKHITDLNAKIEELTNSGNESAMAAQRIQLELDAVKEASENRPENFIEMYVHPIFFYFLKKMTEMFNRKYKKSLSYGEFLVDLFRRDMLHARGNNLPDVISESEYFKVIDKYVEQHPEEFTKEQIKLLKSV